MSSIIENQQIFTLLDVCRSIRKTLLSRYGSAFWVKAEMHKLNPYPASGHCFPDLLQKQGREIVAEMRSVLWKADFERINNRFLEIVKEPLRDGIEIVFQARIQYDPRYGLSLRIMDIDPLYALGSLERERALCVKRLREENLWNLNRDRFLPPVPNRIAVISSQTSKGYSDLLRTLADNPWRYGFHVELFPALLQGESALESLLKALESVWERNTEFDAVLIVRGGGGDVGLNVYNRFELARTVCLFPIPVLTGIGHSTNLTVCEEVAYFHGITPTQLGVFLLQCCRDFDIGLQGKLARISKAAGDFLYRQRSSLESFRSLYRHPFSLFRNEERILGDFVERLERGSLSCLNRSGLRLREQEKAVKWADPQRMLRKGYSLTYLNGKILNSVAGLQAGDLLQTRFRDGLAESRVEAAVRSEGRLLSGGTGSFPTGRKSRNGKKRKNEK